MNRRELLKSGVAAAAAAIAPALPAAAAVAAVPIRDNGTVKMAPLPAPEHLGFWIRLHSLSVGPQGRFVAAEGLPLPVRTIEIGPGGSLGLRFCGRAAKCAFSIAAHSDGLKVEGLEPIFEREARLMPEEFVLSGYRVETAGPHVQELELVLYPADPGYLWGPNRRHCAVSWPQPE